MNNLNVEPQSMNSGIERAALMISEEKHLQDSRKKIHQKKIIFLSLSVLDISFCFLLNNIWKSGHILSRFFIAMN